MPLQKVLNFEKYAILSLAGNHTKESITEIIQRKIKDIKNLGFTFWIENSSQSLPDKVQSFYKIVSSERITLNCLLYQGGGQGNSITNTSSTTAKEFSIDKISWSKIDPKLSPIIGKLKNNSHALVFNQLELIPNLKLNLENYVKFAKVQNPIRNTSGASTFCAIKKFDNVVPKNIKNLRDIYAVAKLHKPYSVWIR